ncbi:hypothetical protein LguiB_022782 [Lonicera macranthoides]
MKSLAFKLTSLIPPHHFKPSKDLLSQPDQLDQSAVYIKQLRQRIEELKREKALKAAGTGASNNTIEDSETINGSTIPPVLELREMGSSLQLVLISGMKKKKLMLLHQVINILEEEGAEVVRASFSVVGHKVFHIIHAKVRVCRIGVANSSVCCRIPELACPCGGVILPETD